MRNRLAGRPAASAQRLRSQSGRSTSVSPDQSFNDRARRTARFAGGPHASSLFRFVEELAADQHPSNLRGACANLVELGVAPETPRRILVDVAVAAQALDRLARHPRCLLGRVEDRAGGVLARASPGAIAAVERLSDRVDV